MTQINNNNITNLPVSFSGFLVSRPCWMRGNSQTALRENFEQSRSERLGAEELARHEGGIEQGMHQGAFQEKVKHSGECKRRFGALDYSCPRCMQLFTERLAAPLDWKKIRCTILRLENGK